MAGQGGGSSNPMGAGLVCGNPTMATASSALSAETPRRRRFLLIDSCGLHGGASHPCPNGGPVALSLTELPHAWSIRTPASPAPTPHCPKGHATAN